MRLLGPRLDFVRILGRIERLDALLLDELPRELQFRAAHPRALTVAKYSFTGIATSPRAIVRDAMDQAAMSGVPHPAQRKFCATAKHKV
jgi:hypothetical protein